MSISLRVRDAIGKERSLDFDTAKVTVGSSATCDITLEDDIDREQAVLVTRGEEVELFDIGVHRRVMVNGQPVGHCVIQPGDKIQLGASTIELADSGVGVAFVPGGKENISASVPIDPVPAAKSTTRGARSAISEKGKRLKLLQEVGRLINSISHEENIFESILDTVFASASVMRGFIALLDDRGDLKVKAHRNNEATAGGDAIEVSSTLIGKVIESGEALLTTDAESDPDLSSSQSIHRLQIRAAICVPLVLEHKVIGVLYGDNRERPGTLLRDDLAFLNALASVAAVAMEQARLLAEYEAKRKIEQALAIARNIHRSFLPSGPPEVEGLDVWGSSVSCDETGGDYYDFLEMPDGSLAAVVADVSGHGIGPALLMATMRASLRTLVSSVERLEDLLPRLNRVLCEDIRDGRFVTFFLTDCDPTTGTVRPVGAGHPPLIWYRASEGAVTMIESGGPPLGILAAAEFPVGEEIQIASGDILLMTTDGILEAANDQGEYFGLERLSRLVSEGSDRSAQEIVERISKEVNDFVGGRALIDDATLVAIKKA